MDHNQRQNELNKVDGNTFAYFQDQERGEEEYRNRILKDEPTDEEENLDPWEGEQ